MFGSLFYIKGKFTKAFVGQFIQINFYFPFYFPGLLGLIFETVDNLVLRPIFKLHFIINPIFMKNYLQLLLVVVASMIFFTCSSDKLDIDTLDETDYFEDSGHFILNFPKGMDEKTFIQTINSMRTQQELNEFLELYSVDLESSILKKSSCSNWSRWYEATYVGCGIFYPSSGRWTGTKHYKYRYCGPHCCGDYEFIYGCW